MPDRELEDQLHRAGYTHVAGIDEAGRGPLAGPVMAAAVILPSDFACPELDDSKKLSPKKRTELYDAIVSFPGLIWATGSCSCEEIDELNILRATHLAMRRATEALKTTPDRCLIDGLPVKDFPFPHDAVVKGDGKSLSIAAASIIAKVQRDRLMKKIDTEFPAYGFANHQGYGTKEHLTALRNHGPCRHHRRSFQPVAQLSLPLD